MPKAFRFALRGFRPSGQGIKQVLGKLEAETMNILWQRPNQTVTEVEEGLRRRREVAHTTVLTTLDRMYRKGYLLREKQGKAFVYTPRYSREEFERGMAQEVLGALIGELGEPVLSTFIDLVGNDGESLDKLEAMIKQKREEHKL